MSIVVSLVILLLVVLFILLAFAVSVALVGRALREREGEWPANWRTPVEEVGPEGIVRAEPEEREAEAEAGAGAHRVA